MKLLWILYKGQKRTRYILFLNLGSKDGKLIGLDAKLIDDDSRTKMLSNKTLWDLSLYAKINWLKKHCPKAIKAYRELLSNNIVSLKEYTIK